MFHCRRVPPFVSLLFFRSLRFVSFVVFRFVNRAPSDYATTWHNKLTQMLYILCVIYIGKLTDTENGVYRIDEFNKKKRINIYKPFFIISFDFIFAKLLSWNVIASTRFIGFQRKRVNIAKVNSKHRLERKREEKRKHTHIHTHQIHIKSSVSKPFLYKKKLNHFA